jgi:alpha-L-fucosidase
VYAHVLKWPDSDTLSLGAPKVTSDTKVTLVGYKGAAFTFKDRAGGGVDVTFPVITALDVPCDWGWVLKMEGLANQKTIPPLAHQLLKFFKVIN